MYRELKSCAKLFEVQSKASVASGHVIYHKGIVASGPYGYGGRRGRRNMLRRAGKCGLILKKQNNVSAYSISKEHLHGVKPSSLVAERYASSTLDACEV
jgi:hypothetical protein